MRKYFGQVGKLKENKIEEYERLHRAVWPGVLKKIHLVLMKLFI